MDSAGKSIVIRLSRVQLVAIRALEVDRTVGARGPVSPGQVAFAAAVQTIDPDGRLVLAGLALEYAGAPDGAFSRAAAIFARTNHPALAKGFTAHGETARAALRYRMV